MRPQAFTALLLAGLAAPAVAGEGQAAGEGPTTTAEGSTRVIIGGALGGGFGARYKVAGQSITFEDRFRGSPDDSPVVAVKVATFGLALSPGLYGGLDLSGTAKAGNVPSGVTTFEKTYIQITNYFGALTWFPWESGLFLKGGAGISTIGIATEDRTESASGFGFLVGAGFALNLGGAHNLTLTVEQSWQS